MNVVTQINPIKKLDAVSFDTLLEHHNPFHTATNCIFDLRGTHLITSSALTQLAAACYALERNGKSPVIMIDDASVRSYLLRSSFVNVVKTVAKIEPDTLIDSAPAYNHLHGSNPMLIEVTKIESGAALPELLDRIVWVLRYRLKYRKHDAFDVATAVSEICQNTFDHNAHTCGFIAMQGDRLTA
jgi:anti-anti-sigma regulatory factor